MTDRARTLTWLPSEPVRFPHPDRALSEPDGLLAAGGALTPEWLLTAYSAGIFPWFNDDAEPILWWSPEIRAGLVPGSMHLSRRFRRSLRQRGGRWQASMDQAFSAVVAGCAAPRRGSDGTWITPAMASAYEQLHRLGHAHSVEIWAQDELIGGIYGIAVGKVFCGESMFGRVTDASKTAFFTLQAALEIRGYRWFDVQMPTPHLNRLGARSIRRAELLAILRQAGTITSEPTSWSIPPQLVVPGDGVVHRAG